MFIIPIALHLYDIVVAFVMGLQSAYIPVVIVSLIHITYLVYVYYKGKSLKPQTAVGGRVTVTA